MTAVATIRSSAAPRANCHHERCNVAVRIARLVAELASPLVTSGGVVYVRRQVRNIAED